MIGEGTIDGDKVEWTFTMETQRGEFTLTYTGTINEDGTMSNPATIRGIDWEPLAASSSDLCLEIEPTPAAAISRFDVSTHQVTYHQTGDLEFTWETSGAVDGTIQNGVSIVLAPADLADGSFALEIASLGIGQHSFTLEIEDSYGLLQASSPIDIDVTPAVCNLINGAIPQSLPPESGQPTNPDAIAVDPPVSSEVILLGRAPDDIPWIQIAYDDLDTLTLTGWLPADQVDCPPDIDIDSFSIVEP